MNESLDRLIDALRQELQQYGALLSFFEKQQEELMRRDGDQVLATVGLIQGQTVSVQEARSHRVRCHQDLADRLSVEPDGQLTTLLPSLPTSRRGQVQALMDENNRLLKRIQQRARQNHVLLSHSLDNMTRVMQTLMGAHQGIVYDGGGTKSSPTGGRAIYEAVG
jgi:flagellar biosynthesis/type III secretory pathway chaperone